MEETDVAVKRGAPKQKFRQKENRHKLKASKRKNNIMREEIETLKNKKFELPELTADDVTSFAKLPLSSNTLKGLKDAGFTVPTKVQRQSLVYSLGGSDVVAAAKTGSGKTLAFIIPILEKLYCSTWTHMDGLGALVITPARELAYQIFDVLNKVGKQHDFSAGLVIGGTDLIFEWKRVSTCNIMICTPGRLLQHMTENPDFACENVQVLVLDEADMCLSMGFADTVNCILEELPTDRQTLLFSATQTRVVKDLIRAGCKNPVFCSVHEHSKTSTPKALVENYVICEAHDKFTYLWSFITSHKKQKILVFLSTCKQVKYIYNMFCKLHPGLCVMALHGNMKQLKRLAIYDQFCRKKVGVLFATDVAARGLDIPEVHWVVQADCPEDVTTYIHRAGRTARYAMAGNALLIVTPSEEPVMVANLKAKNIPIQQIFVDPNKQYSVTVKMDIVLTKYISLKEDAVRAFKAYIKHIAQMKNKKVFNILSVDLDAYARSLGLAVTPRIRFLERALKQKFGDAHAKGKDNKEWNDASGKPRRTTFDFGTQDSSDEDDEFLTSSKTQHVPVDENFNADQLIPLSNKKKKKPVTKEDVAKKLYRKNIKVNKISVFDEEGNVILDPSKLQLSDIAREKNVPSQGINIDELKKIIKEEDRIDKKIHKAKQKEDRWEKKRKEKERRKKDFQEDDEEKEGEDGSAESDVDNYTQELIDSLPDPEKIYGQGKKKKKKKKVHKHSEEEESESDESSSEDEVNDRSRSKPADEESDSNDSDPAEKVPKMSGKRKARFKAREAKRAKMTEGNTLSGLPIDEQEQLALFLLSGKK